VSQWPETTHTASRIGHQRQPTVNAIRLADVAEARPPRPRLESFTLKRVPKEWQKNCNPDSDGNSPSRNHRQLLQATSRNCRHSNCPPHSILCDRVLATTHRYTSMDGSTHETRRHQDQRHQSAFEPDHLTAKYAVVASHKRQPRFTRTHSRAVRKKDRDHVADLH